MGEPLEERYLFEEMPVHKAVAPLAIPTVISQLVTMVYNLADTFFIGQIGNPVMVAAVSLVSPWFNLLTALGNLFGLGGSSLISRMLGAPPPRGDNLWLFTDEPTETSARRPRGGRIPV